MKYKFCTLQSEETIATCIAQNSEEAVEIFAEMKKLPISEFLKIYRVLPAK